MRAIIPCAGQATRFNGKLKELLPISEKLCPLTNSIHLAQMYFRPNDIIIISNPEKIRDHAREIDKLPWNRKCDVYFSLQTDDNLWYSIANEIRLNEDHVLLLGDTITDTIAFLPKDIDFALGLFNTKEPHRFSIVEDNNSRPNILTKPQNKPEGLYKAWGMVYWSKRVSEFFYEHAFDHYDEAFNAAILNYGLYTFDLAYYYDLGSFQAYKEYLKQ